MALPKMAVNPHRNTARCIFKRASFIILSEISLNSWLIPKKNDTFAHLKFGTMPKMKTHSSAKKRFKVTGSGKIKRRKAYTSHIMTKKSKKRKRKLRKAAIVHKTNDKMVRRLLAIGG